MVAEVEGGANGLQFEEGEGMKKGKAKPECRNSVNPVNRSFQPVVLPSGCNSFSVLQMPASETYDWILKKHYARRIPSISWAFGLYDSDFVLQGVCTFGTPASSTLLKGVCGVDWAQHVCELNRLVINEIGMKNLASFFVSRCISLLPTPKIIVSYADSSKGHHGFVYQATNFIYTGLSILTYDPVVKGHEGKHHATSGMGRGMTKDQMVAKYGNDVYWKPRNRKHRYVFFHGTKKQKLQMKKDLRYEAVSYPKGQNMRYDATYIPQTQGVLL